jgi:hypothetical protein
MNALALVLALAANPASPVAGLAGPATHARPAASSTHGAAPADTVMLLQRGERVVLTGFSGSVTVEGVEGDRMELSARGSDEPFEVRREAGAVFVRPAGRSAMGRPLEINVRLPAWADVEVEGLDLGASVTGVRGSVTVAVLAGHLRFVRTSGPVRARTVAGDLLAEDVSGGLSVAARAGNVLVRGASGPVEAESLSGDIILEDVRTSRVRAETQAGDVRFSGAILQGGTYAFFLHSGDVVLVLPADARADVRVSTFHGEFSSEFPTEVSRYESGRRFDFSVGGGGAEVEVEVFQGQIRIVRGG